MAAPKSKKIRIKAVKMFKASVEDGSLPIMLHPDDVVDVDAFTAHMLVSALKAEFAPDMKPYINREWVEPVRTISMAQDPIGAIVNALNALTEAVLGGKALVRKGV